MAACSHYILLLIPPRIAIGPLLLLLLATAGTAAPLELMPMPPVALAEHGVYRTRTLRTGEELWRAQWNLDETTQDGRPILHFHEEGAGRQEGSTSTTWKITMTLDVWGPEPRLSWTKEARDDHGRPLHAEQREFDYGQGVGQIITRDLRTGDTATKTIDLTPVSIPTEVLPAFLRLLPTAADQRMQFALVLRGGAVIRMHAQLAGHERVVVPAGSYDCVKVELVPAGVNKFLARLVLPKIHMWHTEAPPHFWIKYQGPDGGPASREIVRELVRFESVHETASN
jgi:hypothetical protein